MSMEKSKKYKKPLTIDQQVDYLEKTKRVVYKKVSKEESKEFLYTHNYINVISPFKHCFCKIEKNGKPIKDSFGRHIYDNDTDFYEYEKEYRKERIIYPKLYESLLKFETTFNSIVSYEVIHFYNITDSDQFSKFVHRLMANATSSNYTDKMKNRMYQCLSSFQKTMEKYGSIYIFLDRLSLSDTITVFKCCDDELKKTVFQQLFMHSITLGFEDYPTFDSVLPVIVQIRNCVCHGNSLTILCMYYDVKNKSFRSRSDRRRYRNIIKKLQNE